MTDRRPPAFVLTGAFWVVCRNPRYLQELAARGLKILLITPRGWRERALAGSNSTQASPPWAAFSSLKSRPAATARSALQSLGQSP